MHDADTDTYVARRDPVPYRAELTASAVTLALGAGRAVFGAALLANPTRALQLLGVESSSARRMTFLARMAAGRDLALGAGALASRRELGRVWWLLAGAVADTTDAVAISMAARQRTVRPAAAAPVIALAVGAAVIAILEAAPRRAEVARSRW